MGTYNEGTRWKKIRDKKEEREGGLKKRKTSKIKRRVDKGVAQKEEDMNRKSDFFSEGLIILDEI